MQIADIEARREARSKETIGSLAEALNVSMEDLVLTADNGIEQNRH